MSKYIFTENHYNSGDGMITSIWGPPLWHSLHTISFSYPVKPTKEDKKHYFNFFNNLQYVLPCNLCRDNMAKHLSKMPLTLKCLKNRETLSRWVYELHENVNTSLHKKSNLSYEDVREMYEQFRARCLIDPTNKKIKTSGCSEPFQTKFGKLNQKTQSFDNEPLYGSEAQTIINIVPRNNKNKTVKIDPKCKISKKGKCE